MSNKDIRYSTSVAKTYLILLLSVGLDAVTALLTAFLVIPGIKDPHLLLKHNRVTYILASLILLVLWSLFSFLLASVFIKIRINWSVSLKRLVYAIVSVALIGSLAAIITSAVSFPKKIGTVTISKPEEISYIHNYPNGDFKIESDINMKNSDWKSIRKFKGTIDGNGHKISNLTVGKKGFVFNNKGSIRNIKFVDVKYSDFEYFAEFGTAICNNYGEASNLGLHFSKEKNKATKTQDAKRILVGCNYAKCEGNAGKVNNSLYEKQKYDDVYKCQGCSGLCLKKDCIEPNCKNGGSVTFKCQKCKKTYKINLSANGIHTYKVESYTFFRNCNTCKFCNKKYYSYRVSFVNWIITGLLGIAIIILIAGLFGRHSYRKRKDARIIFSVICAIGIATQLYVFFNQLSGVKFYDTWINSLYENEHKYAVKSRAEATYTEKGKIEYNCRHCSKTYTAYIPKKVRPDANKDWSEMAAYKEHKLDKVSESYRNGYYLRATEMNMFDRVTGNLETDNDTDYYKFELSKKGNIILTLSGSSNEKFNKYTVTVYKTNLNREICSKKTGELRKDKEYTIKLNDLEKGKYYIEISDDTTDSQKANSKINYYLTILPKCEKHKRESVYLSKAPTCLSVGEYVTVCNTCYEITSRRNINACSHSWKVSGSENKGSATVYAVKCKKCKIVEKIKAYEYIFPDGSTLKGNFKNGKIEGRAVVSFKDGSVYKGDYSNGKRVGNGKYVFSDKTVLKNSFVIERVFDERAKIFSGN